MGAGKSTIGRHLADELHLDFFDSDQEIERRTGADIAWIFDLDNTLYRTTPGRLAQIDDLMGSFSADFLKVDRVEARRAARPAKRVRQAVRAARALAVADAETSPENVLIERWRTGIRAKAQCRVDIRNALGQLVNRVALHQGETWTALPAGFHLICATTETGERQTIRIQ